MPDQPQPNWQPLTMLPMIAEMITGMANEAATQVVNLRQIEDRPHVLDDATVERIITLYTQTQDDLWVYEEQLRRWQSEQISAAQRVTITNLTARLAVLRSASADILELAQRIKPHTIDAVLARSDVELGLDALLGKKRPR